jgi:hypothetical protein
MPRLCLHQCAPRPSWLEGIDPLTPERSLGGELRIRDPMATWRGWRSYALTRCPATAPRAGGRSPARPPLYVDATSRPASSVAATRVGKVCPWGAPRGVDQVASR